jgi:hypothetical protein
VTTGDREHNVVSDWLSVRTRCGARIKGTSFPDKPRRLLRLSVNLLRDTLAAALCFRAKQPRKRTSMAEKLDHFTLHCAP